MLSQKIKSDNFDGDGTLIELYKNVEVLYIDDLFKTGKSEGGLQKPTAGDINLAFEIINYRYKATSVITVTSNNIDKVRQLMRRQAELMKQGIAIVSDEYSSNVRYEFTGLNKIKQDMVEEATKNAHATAEQFATDTKSDLGDIRSAQQGQFSIEDRDSNTPYIKKIRVVNTMTYSLK